MFTHTCVRFIYMISRFKIRRAQNRGSCWPHYIDNAQGSVLSDFVDCQGQFLTEVPSLSCVQPSQILASICGFTLEESLFDRPRLRRLA